MLNREYRAELIRKYARSPEDDELLARLLDKADIHERSGLMQHSRFLSERDRLCCEPVLRELGLEALFWGGYAEAERTVLILPAQWQDEESVRRGDSSPVSVLRASFRGEESLSHRDFLGALMALGIERALVGDIIPRPGSCDIVLLREIVPYVLQNLSSAGRVSLRAAREGIRYFRGPRSEGRAAQPERGAESISERGNAGLSQIVPKVFVHLFQKVVWVLQFALRTAAAP